VGCAEAIAVGCKALGKVASVFSAQQLPELFALLECLLDYHSQVTTLIATLILDIAVTFSPPAIALSPRILAQLTRWLRKDAQVPAGEADIRVCTAGSCAAAIVRWGVPLKLNDIIHALLAALKTTDDPFQSRMALGVAVVMLATSGRSTCPNPKVVLNAFFSSLI